jgi:hypothetical protein
MPLLFSKGVVLRREYFGGLLFSRRTQSIIELNHDSYRLCSLVDGRRTIEQVVDVFCSSRSACVQELNDFLLDLRTRGFLE